MKPKSSHNPIGVLPRSTPVAGQPSQDAKTQDDGYFDTLGEQMPQMQALFEKLASQEHPDFMAVWQAISEMVAFYTDPEPISGDPAGSFKNESENKCRFCC